MGEFCSVEINLFMSLMLLVIVAGIYTRQKNKSIQRELFLLLCWSTILMQVLDALTWYLNGIPDEKYITANYLANLFLFLFQPIPFTVWLFYLDIIVNQSVKALKKRWYYFIPIVFSTVTLLSTMSNGYVFYIDESNIYHRGPGIIVLTIFYMLLLLGSLGIIIIHRSSTDKRVLSVISIFGIIPVAGICVQIFFVSAPVVWPATAIAVLYVYIFIQIRKDTRDYLTGLLNRQQIDDLILARIRDYSKKGAFSLIMMDMDGFKRINDTYGHNKGDEALIQLAAVLTSCVKSSDKVSRFGGDEFLILLNTDNSSEVEKIIDRIQKKIDIVNERGDKLYHIAVSSGYTVYSPVEHSDFIGLFNDVDHKMYKVKKTRRDE
ncbi:MAG: GGDEF domain-containing protein [Spirochaetales bacterium]|nr:GGDEF domain-containing protein [Spirochaetales bacterium]